MTQKERPQASMSTLKKNLNLQQKLDLVLKVIRQHSRLQPKIGLVLGSGLGALADAVQSPQILPYSQLPFFQETTIPGHSGRLILGQLNGIEVAVLQGRFHRYEGHDTEEVVFPTRTLSHLGIKLLILTNAAGAIRMDFRPGDMMGLTDHLNLTQDNPLIGPNDPYFGPRFLDLSEIYSPPARKILQDTAAQEGIPLHWGVYAGVSGPTYETPAEVRMLRLLGADAVGMSTVHEAIVARHGGVAVLGLSCITNAAAGLTQAPISHTEVVSHAVQGGEFMQRLLLQALPALNHLASTPL